MAIIQNKKTKKGFTLVEVIVVIAIMALVLPAVYALVFAVLKEQVRLYRLTEVKRQGDAVVTLATDLIRNNAYQVYDNATNLQVCVTNDFTPDPDDGSTMYFKSQSGKNFQIFLNSPANQDSGPIKLKSDDTTIANGDITNSKVVVTSFHMTCTRGSIYGPPVINFNFTIQYNTTNTHDTLPLTYRQKVVLRNY
jgi:prepilin-type N-terminal cleavage/methylation domain-containing protein